MRKLSLFLICIVTSHAFAGRVKTKSIKKSNLPKASENPVVVNEAKAEEIKKIIIATMDYLKQLSLNRQNKESLEKSNCLASQNKN